MIYLSRPYRLKICKGSAPQISLGPFLNTLSHFSFARKFISKKLNELPVNIFFRNYIYLVEQMMGIYFSFIT